MTREQAQVYAKLSREDVAKLNSEFGIHYDIICSFARGVKIESKHPEATKWNEDDCPEFRSFMEYRIKETEIAANTAEPWKPRDGDTVFFIGTYGKIYDGCFQTYEPVDDTKRLDFGNCFRTLEEAEAARERVRAALKGETVSKSETVEPTEKIVESLDGHELSNAEKGVIRILRRCKVETKWNGPFVYLEGQKTLSTCNVGVLFKFELGSKASEFGDLSDDVIGEAEERREKGEPSW